MENTIEIACEDSMCALVGVKCFGVAIDRLCNGQITPESGQEDANAKRIGRRGIRGVCVSVSV